MILALDIDYLAQNYSLGELQRIINQYDSILQMLQPSDNLRSIFEHEKGDYECALWVKEYLLDNGRIPTEKVPTPQPIKREVSYKDITA